MSVYKDFAIDNSTNDDLSSFFQINKKEDFIQKVVILPIEVVSTAYGNTAKVSVKQGSKVANCFYFGEITDVLNINGKEISIADQVKTQMAKVAQLGRALQADNFAFKPTANDFNEFIDQLNEVLALELGVKEIYVRFTLKDSFANVASKDGRVFADKAEKLSVPIKDIAKLTPVSASPDSEPKDIF